MLTLFLAALSALAAPPCAPSEPALTSVRDLGLPCATPALWASLRQARACTPRHPATGAHRAADKQLRDATSEYNSLYETENFAIKWGANASFTQADVIALGTALEHAWQVEVTTLGFPSPEGTDTYKFNIYIGDTGMGSPSSYGNAGYFYFDDAGWPMIVIAASQLAAAEDAAATAAHEFFHAVQDAIDTYRYDDRSAWYAEATAMWVESQVDPQSPSFAGFVNWFAIRPELSLNHFEYPTAAFTPEQLHHYGAVVFVKLLEERHGGVDTVRRSLVEAPVGGDPMVVIDRLLAERGTDLQTVFFDLAARDGTWDHRHGPWYEWWLDAYGGYAQDGSHRPTGRVFTETDGWEIALSTLPHTYGANYWELRDLPARLEIAFDGDDGPAWYATVAVREGDVHARHRIPLDGSDVGSVEISGLDEVDEAWLVVAAAQSIVDDGSTWSYAFRIDEIEVDDTGDTGEPEDIKSCGCASTTRAPAFLFVALAVLLGRRRRL